MDAGKTIFSNLFTYGRKLEVPFYQRAYVWEKEQWERLLEDLEFISQIGKPYFIGSIILKKAKLQTWETYATDKKTVVDGQQRLTTMLIFLKAFWLKNGETEKFDKRFRLEDGSLALELGVSDYNAFKTVMEHETTELIDPQSSTSNVIPAFNYFLKEIDINKIQISAILQNLQLVCIDLDEYDEEQQVFDTINSLGVRLTTAELLKNYFYAREDYESYQKNWESIFEKDDETRTYWNQEFDVGRAKRALIDIFLDAYFQFFIQNPKYNVSAEDKIAYSRLGHLAQSYQDFIQNYCNKDKSVVLQSLPEYAVKFRETFDPNCLNRHISKEFGKEHMNVIIFGLKTTTLIPYVLYVAKNVSDEQERNKIYQILEAYVMRRMVTKEVTKGYNRLFISLILNEALTANKLTEILVKNKEDKDVSTALPNDEELLKGFQDSKLVNLQTRGIIYFIESSLRTGMDATSLLGFNQYSLEHLMPKKWRNHWPSCASEELARKRDSRLLTLGNLAIIPQELNASVRDGDWKTKKEGQGENPGLESCAAGLVTLEQVIKQDYWDENKIEDRAKWLYEKAREVWKIPSII